MFRLVFQSEQRESATVGCSLPGFSGRFSAVPSLVCLVRSTAHLEGVSEGWVMMDGMDRSERIDISEFKGAGA